MIPIVYAAAYIVFFLLWAISCFICTRFVNMKKDYSADSMLFRSYTNCIVDSLAQLMRIKLHVSGTEILPEEKFLLAGNHKSAMDPLLTMGVLRGYHMGFIAKKAIFRIPIICRLMHRCFCLSSGQGQYSSAGKSNRQSRRNHKVAESVNRSLSRGNKKPRQRTYAVYERCV